MWSIGQNLHLRISLQAVVGTRAGGSEKSDVMCTVWLTTINFPLAGFHSTAFG